MTVEQEVLNSACDDWENLEQIYRSIVFEFFEENYDPNDAQTYYWRDRQTGLTLASIIGCVVKLVETRMLDARTENGEETIVVNIANIAEVWLKSSSSGMEYLRASL
jgi:hypothetical protein